MVTSNSQIRQIIKSFVSSLTPEELLNIIKSLDTENMTGVMNKTLEEFFIENKNKKEENDEAV